MFRYLACIFFSHLLKRIYKQVGIREIVITLSCKYWSQKFDLVKNLLSFLSWWLKRDVVHIFIVLVMADLYIRIYVWIWLRLSLEGRTNTQRHACRHTCSSQCALLTMCDCGWDCWLFWWFFMVFQSFYVVKLTNYHGNFTGRNYFPWCIWQ